MQFKLPVVKVLLNFTVSFQEELNAIYYLIGCFLFFNIHLSPLPHLYFRSIYKSFPLKNYTLLNRVNLKIEKYQRNSCIIMHLSNIDGFDTIKHAKFLNLRSHLVELPFFTDEDTETPTGKGSPLIGQWQNRELPARCLLFPAPHGWSRWVETLNEFSTHNFFKENTKSSSNTLLTTKAEVGKGKMSAKGEKGSKSRWMSTVKEVWNEQILGKRSPDTHLASLIKFWGLKTAEFHGLI